MIVFGGAGLNGIAKADIHILDLATSKWTTGKPADASQARTNMACAVSGDSFVAWGGDEPSQTLRDEYNGSNVRGTFFEPFIFLFYHL